MKQRDELGIGLYAQVEAARLLKTPRRTLSRWVQGYVQELRGGMKQYAPLLERKDLAALSFADLVELMYVRGFRDAGVSLDRIRQTAIKFREEWQTPYPLATKRFATDGRELLLQQGNDWKSALTGQYLAFFSEIGKQLVHVGDLTSEWRPLGKDHAVVLNPKRAFGKPIDDVSGAHTYILAQALNAGDSEAQIAWWYGTTEKSVKDAARFEREWNTPKKLVVAAA